MIFTKPEIYFIYSSIKFLIVIRLLGTKTIPSNRIEVMNINVTMSRPWHFIWANVLYFTLCIRQFRKVLFGYSERRQFRQIKNHDNCFLCSRIINIQTKPTLFYIYWAANNLGFKIYTKCMGGIFFIYMRQSHMRNHTQIDLFPK